MSNVFETEPKSSSLGAPPTYPAYERVPAPAPAAPAAPGPCCAHHHEHPTIVHNHPHPLLHYGFPHAVVPSPAGPLMVMPPTDTFCPATGGAHVARRRQGGVSIFLSVVTFPVGLVALPFDRKVSCRKCSYVLREAWGNC